MLKTARLFGPFLLAGALCGQQAGSPPTSEKKDAPERATPPAGIAWFGTWERGRAEAKRTGRPILLISAAPHCSLVPGMW